MTTPDLKLKLQAAIAERRTLEAKATKGPLKVNHKDGISYVFANTKIADIYSTAFRDAANQIANAELFAASRNAYLDALMLAEMVLDAECVQCKDSGLLKMWSMTHPTIERKCPCNRRALLEQIAKMLGVEI